MEVQRIPTEGQRINPLRNVERLWLEVVSVPVNDFVVEHRRIAGGGATTRIEIYADRLDAVLAETRTEAHVRAYEAAAEIAKHQTDEWIAENRAAVMKHPEGPARAEFVARNCNVRPETCLALVGYGRGLPPLASCKVVHPHNGSTMDAFEFAKLSHEKRREWLVEAPTTPMNAAQRANENLAEVLMKAFAGNQGGNSKNR